MGFSSNKTDTDTDTEVQTEQESLVEKYKEGHRNFPKHRMEEGKSRSRGNIIYIIFPYYNISISWPKDEWSSLGIPEEIPRI